jgi:MFS family permease
VRADVAQADRNGSIRAAARSWEKAGAIGEETLKAIEAAVPDDRSRVGPVFRILLFLFTVFAAGAAFGFVMLVVDAVFSSFEEALAALIATALGVALAALTEFQTGALKRAQGGTEAGTSFASLGFLIGGLSWFITEPFNLDDKVGSPLILGISALLLAVAAWRWGYPFYAAAAAASFLSALVFYPGGRILWIVLPLITAPILLRLSDSERLPPALRHSCTATLVTGLVGLYGAVHLGSFDLGALEVFLRDFSNLGPASKSPLLRQLSIAATALVPVVYLAIGIRTRRYVFFLLGIGTGLASLVTLRVYVHVAPLWVVLTVSGAALVAVVLALRGYLDSGPSKERGGFTAEPLFEDLTRQRILEAGAAVAAFTPDARTLREEPKYAGGGGEFGGGGSSSEF